MKNTRIHCLVAQVLSALETAKGSPFGTAVYLQVQELLRLLPDDINPERLKTMLGSVLCKDREELKAFDKVFSKSLIQIEATGELTDAEIDALLKELTEKKPEQNKTPSDDKEQDRSLWQIITGLLVVALILAGGYRWWKSIQPSPPVESRDFVEMLVGESKLYPIKTPFPSLDLRNECPPDDKEAVIVRWDSIKPATAEFQNESKLSSVNIYYTALHPGFDSFCLQLKPDSSSDLQQLKIFFTVIDTSSPPPPPPDNERYLLPYPRNLAELGLRPLTGFQKFLLKYEWPLKAVAILFSAVLLGWLCQRIERRRRRLIAEFKRQVKPPYIWNLQISDQPKIEFGEQFQTLSQQFRRREGDELWQLDLIRTIRSTVNKGGLPQFQYTQQSRPAEYLMLIDCQGGKNNHQTRLYDQIYQAFREQEVLVERYWFDEGDPRECRNEKHPQGIGLRELHYLHRQSRLLVLSTGYHLLHPSSGEPLKWVIQAFSSWTDRALLTPLPLSEFGRYENNLKEVFHVLPNSLSGFRQAVQLFDAKEDKAPDLNPRKFPDAFQESVQLIDNDLIQTLRYYFPPHTDASNQTDDNPMVIWIAACAVYPELHWDLTLHLGRVLQNAENTPSQISYLSLNNLCHLPWFVTGEMPLEVRKVLIRWLEREHPETLYKIRWSIHQLLLNNPPQTGSLAYSEYAINLALNEYLFTRDAKRKKELKREIAAWLVVVQPADFMVLRMFDRDQELTPEQFEAPDDWKQGLREKGMGYLFPQKAWWFALPAWGLICAAVLSWQPKEPFCERNPISYKGQECCLDNLRKEVIFKEILLTDAIAALDTMVALPNSLDSLPSILTANTSLDSLLNITGAPLTTGFKDSVHQNTAQAFYNGGIRFLELFKSNGACSMFAKAQQINRLLPDSLQFGHVFEKSRACELPNGDIVLYGRLLDSITNLPLAADALTSAKLSAKGFPLVTAQQGGYFAIDLPDDWISPVELTVSANGYKPKKMTVQDFRKSAIIRMNPAVAIVAANINYSIGENEPSRWQNIKNIQANNIPSIVYSEQIARIVDKITLTHTFSPNSRHYTGRPTLIGIGLYHVNVNGWMDIGDHYYVSPDGMVWTGRSLDQTPAAIFGGNLGAVSIKLILNGDEELPTEAQRRSLGILLSALCKKFNIDPKINFSNAVGSFHSDYDLRTGEMLGSKEGGMRKSSPGKLITKPMVLNWIETYGARIPGPATLSSSQPGSSQPDFSAPSSSTPKDDPPPILPLTNPLPRGSSTYSFADSVFSKCKTLKDVDDMLRKALLASGYDKIAYYTVPNGFAIVTQLEQFNQDGSSATGANRWADTPPAFEGLLDYLKQLVLPKQSYFRTFVFVVSDSPMASGMPRDTIKMEEAQKWLEAGANRLPTQIAQSLFSRTHMVEAFIYEYKLSEINTQAVQIIPTTLTGRSHLEKSGIFGNLIRE